MGFGSAASHSGAVTQLHDWTREESGSGDGMKGVVVNLHLLHRFRERPRDPPAPLNKVLSVQLQTGCVCFIVPGKVAAGGGRAVRSFMMFWWEVGRWEWGVWHFFIGILPTFPSVYSVATIRLWCRLNVWITGAAFPTFSTSLLSSEKILSFTVFPQRAWCSISTPCQPVAAARATD